MDTTGTVKKKRRRLERIQPSPRVLAESSSDKVPTQLQSELEKRRCVKDIGDQDDKSSKDNEKLPRKKRRTVENDCDYDSVIKTDTFITQKHDGTNIHCIEGCYLDYLANSNPYSTTRSGFFLAGEERIIDISAEVFGKETTTYQSVAQQNNYGGVGISKNHIITPETSFLDICSSNDMTTTPNKVPEQEFIIDNGSISANSKTTCIHTSLLYIQSQNETQKKYKFYISSKQWKIILLFFCCYIAVIKLFPSQPFEKDCLYLSGGGFSGFWYILGKLNNLQAKDEGINYLCYSAGCLVSAAALANRTFEELFASAVSIQVKWKSGSISRFDAVETFVDDIFGTSNSNYSSSNFTFDQSIFSKIHIITSVPSITSFMETHVTTPTDMQHFKSLLVQSAWIPFITGNYFWHPSGHIDGGFSVLQHPTCRNHVSLPWDWSIILNTLNINVAKGSAERFWKMGLSY